MEGEEWTPSIVMPDEVVESVRQLKTVGQSKFNNFLDMRINSRAEAFNDTVSRTDLPFFRNALDTKKPDAISERKQLQACVLDVVSAHQAGRNITALSHETSALPPSLTMLDQACFMGQRKTLWIVLLESNTNIKYS